MLLQNNRKLEERLENYDLEKAQKDGEPWLEIIVGSGHHSKVRQKIRPKVEEFLIERQLDFSPVNRGALVVTFEEYTGPKPCFGEYYCTECDHKWINGRSWTRMWQGCYTCHEKKQLIQKCYPLKQRSTRKYSQIVSTQQRSIPHLQELCAKCIELGQLCPYSRECR